ncbi:unnamed protein product [Zymoseptoria tritici ST99CH_1A5]|uniref:Uncharacterized protein n=3 Tax=Zymoseptoria tritici TaxID=1047171 RepID=A0A1X7S6W6_ZYMT9|nr:unnamed protein product [Zymoseptoria tritici ST99CH_3D7]SMR60629.1 unnamed protein product [Zymoseptoria tritici ST99CH_1E4]SMR63740.1 unnamed protein product [Zymoseptoria tritici ST99CH_3D1]SMY29100.1 unnamed protein product [Zymoseptoria tritici ST99CH_1A5]
MSNNPTLINLPPHPSDPVTPSEVPSRSGTPNSTTTSMSELSTVAIKDGHRGLGPHHHHQASGLSSQLDAERADRISRLAGLERVTTARNPQTPTSLNPGGQPGSFNSPANQPPHVQSYFDASGNPVLARERSTVGSASATGSVGARTTWAGSEAGDTSNFDKMSESQDLDMERDTSSIGGGDYMSEDGETGGLVAFGEGARTPARGSMMGLSSAIGSPSGKANATTPRGGGQGDVRMGDDGDTSSLGAGSFGAGGGGFGAMGAPPPQGHAAQQAERIVRENMNTTSQDRMTSHNETSPKRGGAGQEPQLGKFGFEK